MKKITFKEILFVLILFTVSFIAINIVRDMHKDIKEGEKNIERMDSIIFDSRNVYDSLTFERDRNK